MLAERLRATAGTVPDPATASGSAEDVPPDYWLGVGGGRQALEAVLGASTDEAVSVLVEHPVLALPEFPSALERLAEWQPQALARDLLHGKAQLLREVQKAVREDLPEGYASLVKRCGLLLVQETRGTPQRNFERAVRLFEEARDYYPIGDVNVAHCFLNEGTARTQLAALGVDAAPNLQRAVTLYRRASALYPATDPSGAPCRRYEGSTRRQLADLNVDARANLEEAVRLHREGREIAPSRLEAAYNEFEEANALSALARLDVEPRSRQEAAIALYTVARGELPAGSLDLANCMLNEAMVRRQLGETGVEPGANLGEAVRLLARARESFDPGSRDFSRCLFHEAKAREGLARLLIDSRANLAEAIRLHRRAREGDAPDSVGFARSLGEEAQLWRYLALEGVDPSSSRKTAIELYQQARRLLPADDVDVATCLMNEAVVRRDVALDHIVVRQTEFTEALRLCQAALVIYPTGTANRDNCLLLEASLRLSVAELTGDVATAREAALEECRQSRQELSPDSPTYAPWLQHEATVRMSLAELGRDVKANLEAALALQQAARHHLPRDTANVRNTLQGEASVRGMLSDLGLDPRANLQEAVRLWTIAREGLEPGSRIHAQCLGNEWSARRRLVRFGVGGRPEIERGITVQQEIRTIYEPGSEAVATTLIEEANCHTALALRGVNVQACLDAALALYAEAATIFGPGTLRAAPCLTNQATVRLILAERGIDSRLNLEAAIELCGQVRALVPDGAARTEANARERLADLGVEPALNCEAALRLCMAARDRALPGTLEFALSLVAEGNVRKLLAEVGGETTANAEEAIRLYRAARQMMAAEGEEWATTLVNEALVLMRRSDLGDDVRGNLEAAARLCADAQQFFLADSPQFAWAAMNEANARQYLADIGVDTRMNLETAIRLCRAARGRFLPNSLDIALCCRVEADALQSLALQGIEATPNLQAAAKLYAEAQRVHPPDSPDFARCLRAEGTARCRLAEHRVEANANLEKAVGLFQSARERFASGTDDHASCVSNEAAARIQLAYLGITPKEQLEEAIRLIQTARATVSPERADHARGLANEAAALEALAGLGVDSAHNGDTASMLYQGAADRLRSMGRHLEAISLYEHLGRSAVRIGDWEGARKAFGTAVQTLEQIRTTTLLMRDRREWMRRTVGLFTGLVEACLHLGRHHEAAEAAESGRSRNLLDMLYLHDFAPRHCPPSTLQEYRETRDKIDVQAALLAAPEHAESGRAISIPLPSRDHAALLLNLRRLEDEIRAVDPDYFALARPVSVAEAIEIARQLDRTVVTIWVGVRRSAAFCVTPSGQLEVVDIPAVHQRAVVEEMVGPLDDPRTTGWMGAYLDYREPKASRRERRLSLWRWMDQIRQTGGVLYETLLAPIHERLNALNQGRVVFVVGGLLGLLPLHAASWNVDGETHYLLDGLDITYAPSVWVLRRCLERRRGADVPVLTVASGGDQQPLPFTEWEAQRIGALVAGRKGPGAHRSALGPAATIEAVLQALPAHSIAHLACHGAWNGADPLASALSLANGEVSLAQLLGEVRLDRARLVVLSACESATGYQLGRVEDEYLGLPAGFIFAGARAVVGSLWPVADAPTALLMVALYRNLLDQMPVSDALRRAQSWLRQISAKEAVDIVRGTLGDGSPLLPTDVIEDFVSWVTDLGPHPFEEPYFWAAFQVLGAPDAAFGP